MADGSPGAGGVIEVALGETRVGEIPAAVAAGYLPVLGDAAARDEHPRLDAQLTVHNDKHLLEIATPPDST